MKKIKVAQIITRMDWGGSPDVLRLLCTHLDAQQFDLHVFVGETRYPGRKTLDFFRDFRGRITFIPQLKRDIHPCADLAAFWRLYLALRRGGFDVVHTHTAKAGALGRLAARMAGVPVVVHMSHGHNFYGYFNRFASKAVIAVEKILSCITDRLIVLTELELSDCLAFAVCPAQKLELIRTAFDIRPAVSAEERGSIRQRYAVGPEETAVGFVGRLEPVKGADIFIEAALQLAASCSQTRIFVVGDGSLRRTLEAGVSAAGLSGRIVFLGWQEDAAGLMPLFDVLALASRNEAVGIALLEAQAAGVPVVATRVGGIPEALVHGQTGLLVEPGDSAALARALGLLLDDRQRRQAMGAAARKWVENKFDPLRFAGETGRLYRRLSGGRS